MKEINYIDLGLKSGTRWCDCYLSQTLTSLKYRLFKKEDPEIYIPTIYDFIELKNSCSIRKVSKGSYILLIVTGPNGNRIRLFHSVLDDKPWPSLIYYWIDNGFLLYKQKSPKTVYIEFLLNFYNEDSLYRSTEICNEIGNLLYVKK